MGEGAATNRQEPVPVLPEYGGACIDSVVPALQSRNDEVVPSWLPPGVAGSAQVVLLVLDGLGWDQLREREHVAPFLAALRGTRVTSVAPTTTATALTSLTTGVSPAVHGTIGYRVRVGPADVLNVLRWRTAQGDARQTVPPTAFQTAPVFGGLAPPVVTRAEFSASGFTMAHLPGVPLSGWRMASSLVGHVRTLVGKGDPFVYAYYDGIDKVAHEYGFGSMYDDELAAADRLAADVAAVLPPGAVLVVTADHGQVEVGDALVATPAALLGDVDMMSGEGRWRWWHARPGTAARLAAGARDAFADVAWVRTVDELDADGWFGGPLSPLVRSRLGDVAIIAHAPVAFPDPADSGENRLRCRHGSLTSAEVWVPLLALAA
jgi:hypothetical protein